MAAVAEGRSKAESWDETTVTEYEDGSKLTRASIVQSYSGDMEGSSQIEYTMIHAADKSARFIGYERMNCKIGGKQGEFVLQHDGKFSIGVASSNFKVVSGSGRGELMNISGEGRFTSLADGESEYHFDYNTDSSEDQVGA